MLSLSCFNLRFTTYWGRCLLAVSAILFFIRLGLWQIDRAEEKKQMVMAHKLFANQSPVLWTFGGELPLQYQKIKVQGSFLSMSLLFDNQHYQHQFGYHVISPLLLVNGEVILVDRGWISGDITRQSLPVISSPTGQVNIIGSAYYPSEKNWVLGQMIEEKGKDLAVVELLDTHKISQVLHKSVYPFIIRLGKDEAAGFVREWSIVAMSPMRHYGYALQWFAMALVVLILFITLNTKRRK